MRELYGDSIPSLGAGGASSGVSLGPRVPVQLYENMSRNLIEIIEPLEEPSKQPVYTEPFKEP